MISSVGDRVVYQGEEKLQSPSLAIPPDVSGVAEPLTGQVKFQVKSETPPLKDEENEPFVCGKGPQDTCQCPGMLWFGL